MVQEKECKQGTKFCLILKRKRSKFWETKMTK